MNEYSKQITILLLRSTLASIAINDTNYEKRYGFVLNAMAIAHELGYESGIRIDPNESEWPVVYIELPTGQVSWHLPQHTKEYDGHTTEEKYDRIHRYCNS